MTLFNAYSFIHSFLVLTKARVIVLMMSTSYVGMILAPGSNDSLPFHLSILLGLSCIAGAGAVSNHIFDRDLDRQMKRTQHRPLVKDVFTVSQAIGIGITLWIIGSIILLVQTNILTWELTMIGAIGYGLIYTCFLKTASPQNIVLGGISGALPPLLGWTAICNTIDPPALLLVALIFVWTPAHFWALALQRQEEYAKVQIPMLSVTHGPWFTALAICLYTTLLFPVCWLLWITHIGSLSFLIISTLLTFIYLVLNLLLLWQPLIYAPLSFRYSIVYLYLLFFAMICEKIS